MIHVLAQANYEELQKFISIFATRGAAMRRKHGCLKAQLFRVPDQENRAVILFEWESREAFEGFLSDPDVPPTMRSSGTIGRPEFTILEEIAQFPG